MDFAPCHLCDRRQRPPVDGKSACLADPERRDIIVLVRLGICPHPDGPRFTATEMTVAGMAVAQASPREPIEVRGPALWAKLHKRPLEWPGGDDTAWLQQFSRDVGCGSCAAHWRSWVQFNPPDFSSARAYADWGRRGHNHVNVKLGRREWPWDEFGRMWGY